MTSTQRNFVTEHCAKPLQLSDALRIVQRTPATDLNSFQVLLSCGFTPLHLQTFLQAHLQLRMNERRAHISTGLYGDVWGTLTQLRDDSIGACVIVLEWADLDPRLGFRQLGGWGPQQLPDILSTVEKKLTLLHEILKPLSGRLPVCISCPTLPLPPVFFTPASQFAETELRLYRALDEFALWATAEAHFKVVNQERLLEISPYTQRRDLKGELLAGISYTTAHSERLASLLAEILIPPPAKKGLISDLDDTLWRGAIGEIGSAAVSWDLPSHSQQHGLYQQLLCALAEQGVLIALASKNDPELVQEAFQRKDILLPPKCVFPLEVHWRPKSDSVGNILRTWNIGADSVVFVDDSPMELAEVKTAYPQIECIPFPATDYNQFTQLLYRLRQLFAKDHITLEDRIRQESLASATRFRADAQRDSSSYEEFMRQAEALITLDFSSSANPRILELVNKTNQFNLNGLRFTESDWRNRLVPSTSFVATAEYRDKYGPLGVISVLQGHLEDAIMFVDTWVMSCRAFARRIEYQVLNALFERFSAETAFFDFQPTSRNGCLQEFFAVFLGAKPSSSFELSYDVFREKCPCLYQKVEIRHE